MLDRMHARTRHPGATAPSPAKTYRIGPGDTLETVAARFGLTDAQSYAELARLNPALASGRSPTNGIVRLPDSVKETQGPSDPTPAEPKSLSPLQTTWTKGFNRKIAGQNAFNGAIRSAVENARSVDPLVLKSLLAQESNFQPSATNTYGYAGIAQIGVSEARSVGLKTGSSRMRHGRVAAHIDRKRDERLDAAKAIRGAASVLEQKAQALQPSFARYGTPAGDDYWRFVTASYNGGEGTIGQAMKIAYGDSTPSEVRWSDVVDSKDGDIRHSPLYRACQRVFPRIAREKYFEISGYARDVLLRARQ